MKNNFAEEYAQSRINLKLYRDAQTANDAARMDKAREAHRAQEAQIEAKGAVYSRLYAKYESAQERGNEYIDWDDVIWDKDVEGFVNGLRDCGIEKFVFSSTWTSAVETAWLLQMNGCKLEGLVEINGHRNSYGLEGFEKKHGYLFSVN